MTQVIVQQFSKVEQPVVFQRITTQWKSIQHNVYVFY